MSDSAIPWSAARQASLSFTISWSLLWLMSTELMISSNHLTLCHPLLLLPSIFLRIRVFSSESALCIRWPKSWSFSFSIVLPMDIQGWFLLGFTGLVSLLSRGLSRVFSSTTVREHQFFGAQPSLWHEKDLLYVGGFLFSSLGTLAHPLAQIFSQGSLPLRTAQSWSLIHLNFSS